MTIDSVVSTQYCRVTDRQTDRRNCSVGGVFIFTARCTTVQSAVLLYHVVHLSDCDVGGS